MMGKNRLLVSMTLVLLLLGVTGIGAAYETQDGSGDHSGGHSCVEPDYTMAPRPAELRQQIYDRQTLFNALDKNQDGRLSWREYNGPGRLFRDLDQNGDRRLSWEEAKYMITFAKIPSGSFAMGSDTPVAGLLGPVYDGMPAHQVSISEFFMSTTEITNAQYALYLNSALKAGEITVELGDAGGPYTRVWVPLPAYTVRGAAGTEWEDKIFTILSPVPGLSHLKVTGNPALISEHPLNQSWLRYSAGENRFYVHPGFEDHPASFIRWYGAKAFADFYGLDLPTEAEWEYAARGGQQFRYPTSHGLLSGDDVNFGCYNTLHIPNYTGIDEPENYVGFKLAVGSYPPNPYGLYDLAGSVFEFVLDWYDENFYQYCVDNGILYNPLNTVGEEPPLDAAGGPGQPFSHDARVCRGGAYNYSEVLTDNAFRYPIYPFIGIDHTGLRVVLRSPRTVFNGTEPVENAKPGGRPSFLPED